MGDTQRVLVVDDERLIRWSIRERLAEEGYDAREAADARSGLAGASEADAVILDYRLPDLDGFEVLERLRSERPRVPVIMLTAHSSVEHAVQAMKLGAFDYVGKPCELDDLVGLVRRALDRRRPAPSADEPLLGESDEMRRVRELVQRIAVSPSSTVLVTGESGTGKSLVAQVIHRRSDRRDAPFVTVTCSAIPEQLLEAELFGHEKGAFTGAGARRVGLIEAAEGGTLFLDEIGEMPPAMQAKLLGVLESRTYRRVGGTELRHADVRIVAATNVDLKQAVADGRFREDLYYRLAVMKLHLTPLRARPDDVPVLAQRFLEVIGGELGRRVWLGRGTLGVLRGRQWPGNARQLRNELERAVLLMDGDELKPEHLTEASALGDDDVAEDGFVLPGEGVDMETLERELLEQALRRSRGNQRVAGELLGMNRDQVRYRMAKYDIPSRRKKRGE